MRTGICYLTSCYKSYKDIYHNISEQISVFLENVIDDLSV